MTLKGRKNHYNVKLLRGYGVSISLKNNKVILRNGRDIFTGSSDVEEWFVTKIPYEKIVVSGRGYPNSSEIPLYEGDSSPKEIPPYENDVGITPIDPNK